MRKNMKHGLWSGKKHTRARHKENRIDFEEFREDYYEDDYEDDYRDDYDERDYAEDDDYYSEDYDDVDRDYEYEDERRGGRRSDDRYEDDVDYRDDERYEDDEDYRDDEQYEEDDNYRDDERYEDEEDYSDDYADDRYEDDEDYSEDDRYEDDEEYRDDYDERYDDEYYEDDYEYDRYEDEDRYAPVSAREKDREGRGFGSSKRGKKKKDKAVKSKAGNRKNKDGKDNAFAGIIKFIANTSAVERTAAIVGLVLLAGAVTTGVFFAGVMGKNRTISSFAEVGSNMGEVEVVGQSGLLAIADAEKAKSMTAEIVVESEEEELVQDDAEGVVINMNLTTIKSDMKIKFVNSKTNKLVASVPFKVSVVTPDGSSITYEDDDKDGIIYKKELKAGKYKVTPNALPSEYSKYNVDTSTKTLTVKDTVEMKPVDVSNEVKKESQVNAAKEDTAVKTQVESQLKDTVEWVESTKTPVDGEAAEGDGDFKYEKIDNSTIVNPIKFSFANGTFYRTAMFFAENSNNSTSLISNPAETGDNDKGTNGTTTDSGDTSGSDKQEQNNDQNNNDNNNNNNDNTQTPPPAPVEKFICVNGSKNPEVHLKAGEQQSISITDDNGNSISGVTGNSEDKGIAVLVGETIKAASLDNDSSTTITLSKEGYTSCKIKVNVEKKPEPKIIKYDWSNTTVTVGQTISPSSVTGEGGKAINYSIDIKSQNPAGVIEKSGNGVKGLKAGSATVVIKADGYPDTGAITITVKDAPLKNMKASVPGGTHYVGDTVTPTVTDEAGKAISFSLKLKTGSMDAVKINGTSVSVTRACNITLTVESNGYNPKDIDIVFAAKKAMKLNTTDKMTMKVGDVLSKVVAEDVNDKNIKPAITSMSSDKPDIVQVDGTKLKALKAGTAKITVKAKDYPDCFITVTVTGGKGKLKISNMTLMEGKKVNLSEGEVEGATKLKLTSSNTKIVKIDGEKGIYPVAKGDAEVTVEADGAVLGKIKVHVLAKTEPLKDNKGNELYFKDKDGKFKAATLADYDPKREFFTRTAGKMKYKYTGWQTIDGKTYFYTKDHEYVTGEQVIQGVKYSFNSDGVLQSNNGGRGIDVSKWNGSIDWKAVKNEGIEFAIIRCGYRGSSAGALIEDPTFRTNIKGAQAAGIKVGIYFFTQAVNEVEAVEEASMAINLAKGYGLSFPIYLDVEGSNGRGDSISAAQRTANIKAFCGTVQNAGYKAGVYANKTWFNEKINTGSLTNYKIWLAQYAASPTYSATRYDMWQYTSKGRVSGISGNVDLNICYR